MKCFAHLKNCAQPLKHQVLANKAEDESSVKKSPKIASKADACVLMQRRVM